VVLTVQPELTPSQFLLFMLLKLLYSLLRELRLVLHYAIVVLLVLTIFQNIVCWKSRVATLFFWFKSVIFNVLYGPLSATLLSGSWRILASQAINDTFFFLFSLPGVAL
jgi:hypothetical protein